MSSPPLAPDDGPIDTEHLRRMTLGDIGLENEVIAMFSAQAAGLIAALRSSSPDMGTHAHTLKGSARAIGAFGVAEAAEDLEAAIRSGANPAGALARLDSAVAQARVAIDALLRRS